MKLLVLSDLHLEFGEFTPPSVDVDVVVIAGDVAQGLNGLKWLRATFPALPVLYVLGNHEFYGQTLQRLIEKLRAAAEGTNIHILECDRLDLGGVTFLGTTLWTDFLLFGDANTAKLEARLQMNDFKRIRVLPGFRKLRPEFAATLHARSIVWLRQQFAEVVNRKIVVITHHAPSLASLPAHRKTDVLSPFYASNLESLAASSGAALWVHGHIHASNDYRLGETRVVSNPRGYADGPNSAFQPGLVVEI